MTGPGPETLAGAWLAKIPPAQLVAAHNYTDANLAAWAGGLALLLGGCVLVARLRLLPRLVAAIERDGPRPWLRTAAGAAALALLLAVAKALYDAAAGAWTDGVLAAGGGVTPGPGLAARLQIALTGVVPVVLGAILFVPLAAWLMRRLPRAWPVVVGSALAAVILTVGWLPYALAAGPQLPSLPAGPLRAALAPMVAAAKLPAPDILADPSPGSLTDVTGGLAPARVVVGDDAASDTPAEARAYVGHLIGHYVHSDILVVTLVVAATLTLGAFAIQRFAAPLARLLGALDAKAPHEPAALPALAMLAILTVVAAGLAGAAYLRWANVRADAYSLDLAREPEGLASVLVKAWDHASVDPNPLEEALFYTHPPLKRRLVQAMTWETAQK